MLGTGYLQWDSNSLHPTVFRTAQPFFRWEVEQGPCGVMVAKIRSDGWSSVAGVSICM